MFASARPLVAALALAGLCGVATLRGADSTNAAPDAPAMERDLAAARFITTCAGCHSVTGAKLNGPELSHTAQWPVEPLRVAIKKMESKTGPLPDDLVAQLADFLKSPDLRERLTRESERIAAQFAAKMAPADPALGRALFHGSRTLENGGLSCAACHSAGGTGGNLGPALDPVFAKTGGELPLISAIEQSKFPLMEPHYERHRVTRQEAMHLAKYLSTLDPKQPPAGAPDFGVAGLGAAALLLAGMFITMKQQRHVRRHDTRLERRRK
jgi:cytochrome c553